MDQKKFSPAWWLPGPHLQTLWSALIRRPARVFTQSERLELPDGDFLDLVWAGPDVAQTVLILHGLEGSIRSPYASGMLASIAHSGRRGLVMHFRGCSGIANRLPRSYHSGDTGDIGFVIDSLRKRRPDRELAAIGISLGGNALLKYLGERGKSTDLRAAVAVSVPFELGKAADKLERGFSRLYQWRLMRSLRAAVHRKSAILDGSIDLDRAARARTFREFDEWVTAPLHGFTSAEDYYEKSSSRQYLKRICLPTLIVHAYDDPFMTPAAIPTTEEFSSAVEFELCASGGHVGFVSGTLPGRPRYWLEQRVNAFLAEHLD